MRTSYTPQDCVFALTFSTSHIIQFNFGVPPIMIAWFPVSPVKFDFSIPPIHPKLVYAYLIACIACALLLSSNIKQKAACLMYAGQTLYFAVNFHNNPKWQYSEWQRVGIWYSDDPSEKDIDSRFKLFKVNWFFIQSVFLVSRFP